MACVASLASMPSHAQATMLAQRMSNFGFPAAHVQLYAPWHGLAVASVQ